MTQDLTKGKPFPTILTFSLPVIGGNLFQLFYTLADSVIVGQALGQMRWLRSEAPVSSSIWSSASSRG